MHGSLSEQSIRVGTAGFKYKDWVGPFYPETLSDKQMLEYYAQQFSLVELDFTYYQIPGVKTMANLTSRTPDGFTFVVKGHRSLTHDDLDLQAVADASASFRSALAPVIAAGKLGAILLQFPYRFTPTRANCDRLLTVHEQLSGLPAVVEFRRADWVSEKLFSRTLDWLRQLDIGYCCVDEPRLRGLVPPVYGVSSSVAYVRFHGRNADKWWKHEHAWERYNYEYNEQELAGWVFPIRKLAEQANRVYVVFNNHYGGSAARNAVQMRKLLDSC